MPAAQQGPQSRQRPRSPERRIERIRNRSERRIKHWRQRLETQIGREKAERRRRIAEIKASLSATSVSERGVAFIAGHEGIILHAYNDPAGHCTAGIGHLIHLGNCTAQDFAAWGDLTRPAALRLLGRDLGRFEEALRRLVDVELDQMQFDALASFIFNVGEGAFASSTLLRRLNAGDYRSVPSELMRWVNAGGGPLPGLVARRKAEGRLFAGDGYHD